MKRSQTMSMNRRGGLLVRLILVLGGLFLLGAIAWVVLLSSLVVSTVRSRTGFAVKVDHLSVNPFSGRVALDGVLLENPDGWPEKGFVELRHLKVEAEVFSLFSDRMVFDEALVDVARITLVTNAQGRMNAVLFNDDLMGKKSEAAGGAPAASPGKKQEFLIRHLVLKCDQLVYADFSGGRSLVKSIDLHLNRDLQDVDSVAKILSPVSGAALGALTNAWAGITKTKPEALRGAVDALQQAGRKTGETLKNFFRSLENKKP